MRRPDLRTRLLVGALALLVGACGSVVPSDPALEGKLAPLLESSGPTRLAELTSYDWDRVYLFTPYTSASEVNDTVGGRILDSWQSVPESEDLLVFSLDRHPVRVARIAAFVFPADLQRVGNGWSRDVLLQTRCGFLFLHEPGEKAGPEDCGG